MMKKTSGK